MCPAGFIYMYILLQNGVVGSSGRVPTVGLPCGGFGGIAPLPGILGSTKE